MGLAAKLGAAGGAYAVANAGVNQYQQHQQEQQQPGGYGAAPLVPGQYGAPALGQYGAPSQQFQVPPPQDNSAFQGILAQKLHHLVAANSLQVTCMTGRLPCAPSDIRRRHIPACIAAAHCAIWWLMQLSLHSLAVAGVPAADV